MLLRMRSTALGFAVAVVNLGAGIWEIWGEE